MHTWARLELCLSRASPNGVRTFRNGQCWAPLVPQNIQTDRSIRIDIRVINLRRKRDFRGLEGIIGGEGNGEEEDTAGVR